MSRLNKPRLNKHCLASIIIVAMFLLNAAQIRAAPTADLFLPLLLGSGTTIDAAGQGRPWTNHTAPFDFLFGNHKDQHQQSKIVPAAQSTGTASPGSSKLVGFLYIVYSDTTGEVPKAQHVACGPETDCRVGWLMHGVNAKATLVTKGQGRPQYCVDAALQPLLNKGYTHFHWVKESGACLREGNVYNGYLIQLIAQDRFEFFHSGNEGNHGGTGEGCGDDDEGGCSDDEGDCSGDDSGCGEDEDGCSDDDGVGSEDDGDDHDHADGDGEGIRISPGPDWDSHRNVAVCTDVE